MSLKISYKSFVIFKYKTKFPIIIIFIIIIIIIRSFTIFSIIIIIITSSIISSKQTLQALPHTSKKQSTIEVKYY